MVSPSYLHYTTGLHHVRLCDVLHDQHLAGNPVVWHFIHPTADFKLDWVPTSIFRILTLKSRDSLSVHLYSFCVYRSPFLGHRFDARPVWSLENIGRLWYSEALRSIGVRGSQFGDFYQWKRVIYQWANGDLPMETGDDWWLNHNWEILCWFMLILWKSVIWIMKITDVIYWINLESWLMVVTEGAMNGNELYNEKVALQ